MKGHLTEVLQRAVAETGLGVVDVAERAGVDPGQLSRFLRNKRSLTLPAVESLCTFLGLELRPIKPVTKKGKR